MEARQKFDKTLVADTTRFFLPVILAKDGRQNGWNNKIELKQKPIRAASMPFGSELCSGGHQYFRDGFGRKGRIGCHSSLISLLELSRPLLDGQQQDRVAAGNWLISMSPSYRRTQKYRQQYK
jgi:hypothetical protein